MWHAVTSCDVRPVDFEMFAHASRELRNIDLGRTSGTSFPPRGLQVARLVVRLLEVRRTVRRTVRFFWARRGRDFVIARDWRRVGPAHRAVLEEAMA